MALDLEKRIKDAGPSSDDVMKTAFENARNIIYRATPANLAEQCGITNSADYKNALEFLFDNKMDDSILKSLLVKNENSTIVERLTKSRSAMKQLFLNNGENARAHSILGQPVADFFQKSANEAYKSKQWMKLFGGLTIAVIGITLIAQLFFGRMKDEKLYLNKGAQNAGK